MIDRISINVTNVSIFFLFLFQNHDKIYFDFNLFISNYSTWINEHHLVQYEKNFSSSISFRVSNLFIYLSLS